MPRIIAVSNQKGGVGKTTTAVNLATALALEDHMVLLVDLDPQGNASSGLSVPKSEVSVGVADVMLGFRDMPDAVVPTCVDGLHLLPATRELIGLEIELVEASRREYRLKRALDTFAGPYDFVIIDCPPALNMLTINGLASADGVLIPVQAEYYAMVTGCAEGLGLKSLAEDLGWKAEVRLWTDSSAAKAIGNRRGLGKLRHVELKWLWVQDVVKEGRVKLKTVKGTENVADHLTKPKSKAEVEELLRRVGAEFED